MKILILAGVFLGASTAQAACIDYLKQQLRAERISAVVDEDNLNNLFSNNKHSVKYISYYQSGTEYSKQYASIVVEDLRVKVTKKRTLMLDSNCDLQTIHVQKGGPRAWEADLNKEFCDQILPLMEQWHSSVKKRSELESTAQTLAAEKYRIFYKVRTKGPAVGVRLSETGPLCEVYFDRTRLLPDVQNVINEVNDVNQHKPSGDSAQWKVKEYPVTQPEPEEPYDPNNKAKYFEKDEEAAQPNNPLPPIRDAGQPPKPTRFEPR